MSDQIEYPKIETLYDRDPKTHRVTDEDGILLPIRLPEFSLISRWLVTEKIDGTNVRVFLTWEDGKPIVRFGGRTDSAQMPTFLLNHLQEVFTPESMVKALDKAGESPVTIFGEGYGEKIQSGGWYRDTPGFRIFDVLVGPWWLRWPDIVIVAEDLGVETVPVLDYAASIGDAVGMVDLHSQTALEDGGDDTRTHEGVVARTEPMLFTRSGGRVMWKLKGRDFRGGKR